MTKELRTMRLIDADLLMRKCEKWLKPKAPDEDEMFSLARQKAKRNDIDTGEEIGRGQRMLEKVSEESEGITES